jgi:hypothetical protein
MFNQPFNLSKKVTCSFTGSHHQKEEQYAICIETPLILLQSEQLQNTILHRTSSQSIVFLKFKAGTISIMLPRERKRENTLFFRSLLGWHRSGWYGHQSGYSYSGHPPWLTPPPTVFPAIGALVNEKDGSNGSES